MSADTYVALQATIAGMGAGSAGGAETILAGYDLDSGVLLVDGARSEEPGTVAARDDDSVVVTNDVALVDHDQLFLEDQFREAITAYFSLQASGQLEIDTALMRHSPAGKIEPDGVDEKGRKFRVAPDISNGQLAIIALCWLALRQRNVATQIDAFDEMPDLDVMTIGLPASMQTRSYGPFAKNMGFVNWADLE